MKTYTQNKVILRTIMNGLDLNFNFINNVLSSSKLVNEEGDKIKLWFHFGKIKVVRKEDQSKKAGEIEELDEFTFEENGDVLISSYLRKE